MSVAEWADTYGIHHWRILLSSHRKLAWVRFEPTTTEFRSNALSYLAMSSTRTQDQLCNIYIYIREREKEREREREREITWPEIFVLSAILHDPRYSYSQQYYMTRDIGKSFLWNSFFYNFQKVYRFSIYKGRNLNKIEDLLFIISFKIFIKNCSWIDTSISSPVCSPSPFSQFPNPNLKHGLQSHWYSFITTLFLLL